MSELKREIANAQGWHDFDYVDGHVHTGIPPGENMRRMLVPKWTSDTAAAVRLVKDYPWSMVHTPGTKFPYVVTVIGMGEGRGQEVAEAIANAYYAWLQKQQRDID